MSRRFRKPLEKKSVREDRKGAKRGAGKSASGKGPGKPSFGAGASEKRGSAACNPDSCSLVRTPPTNT